MFSVDVSGMRGWRRAVWGIRVLRPGLFCLRGAFERVSVMVGERFDGSRREEGRNGVEWSTDLVRRRYPLVPLYLYLMKYLPRLYM